MIHSSHRTRFSNASTFDTICIKCGATDHVPGGDGDLEYPCPHPESPRDDEVEIRCSVNERSASMRIPAVDEKHVCGSHGFGLGPTDVCMRCEWDRKLTEQIRESMKG